MATLRDWRDSPELPRNSNNPYYWRRDESIIDMIVIHHTAGYGTVKDVNASDLLRDWSSNGSGAYGPHLSYHYFIESDGIIYWANYHDEIAWHAANANTSSIGIALQGMFEPYMDDNGILISNQPTDEQLTSLQWLLTKHLPANGVNVGRNRTYGHGDVYLQQFGNSTACPGLNLRQRVINYRLNGEPFMSTENEDVRYFPETKHYIAWGFLSYFDAHGGIDQLGLPLDDEHTDTALGCTVQNLERARLEYHPNNPDPYKVQLGLVNSELISCKNK